MAYDNETIVLSTCFLIIIFLKWAYATRLDDFQLSGPVACEAAAANRHLQTLQWLHANGNIIAHSHAPTCTHIKTHKIFFSLFVAI